MMPSSPFQPWISQSRLSLAAVLVGLISGLGQVVILRELMILAGGNELSLGLGLACWLFWGGTGSLVTGLLAGRQPKGSPALPLLIAGAGSGASLLLARLTPSLLGLPLGLVPSLGQILTISLLVLAPAGWAEGAAFPLLLAAAPSQEARQTRLLPWLYGADGLGHTAAAALFALLLVRWLNPVALVSAAALLGAAAALWVAAGRWRRPALIWALVLAAALLASGSVDNYLRARQWQGREVAGYGESPYAQLLATASPGQVDFFASGMWLFSYPDRQHLERSALLPLLARPGAKRALFIGGGADGVAAEAARRGELSQTTVVELDPWLIRFATGFRSEQPPPEGFSLIYGDGRVFLEKAKAGYDLIVLQTPPPLTVQSNRFYSLEGFAALARALKPDGVAALSLPGMEALVGRLQAAQLSSILAAARLSFERVVLMSGPELRLFLSHTPQILPAEAAAWQERLARQGWSGLAALRPDTLELELDPLRLAYLKAAVEQAGPQPPNTDLRPRALLLDPQLWGSQAGGHSAWADSLAGLGLREILWPLAGAVGLFFLLASRPRLRGTPLPVGVFVTGLTSMSLSVLLLMAYQALFGAVYFGLALLLAGFMLGLAAAALILAMEVWPLKSHPRGLALITSLLILACLTTLALVNLLTGRGSGFWGAAALVVMAALDGGLTGAFFGLAGQLRLKLVQARLDPSKPPPLAWEGGKLYGLDLAGGLIGALLPVVLLPTLGLAASLVILAELNLVPLSGYLGQIAFGSRHG